MEDIFKMENQIASGMSDDDRKSIEGMDMEKMLSHVTKNVFKMMGGGGGDGGFSDSPLAGGLTDLIGKLNLGKINEPEAILPKTRDIRFDLNVELFDFYSGKIKKLNIKRKRIIEENGKQKVIEEKKRIVIPIEKGMKDEQQIRFEGEADQIPGYTPGDIIITLVENEHPFFQRDNDNLIIVKNINLYQLYDYSFNVTHLDSRVLHINKNKNDALHLNDSFRKITGQGMPIYKSNKYGDLFIRFNLVIPKQLEQHNLEKLKEIFENDPLTLENQVIDSEQKFILEHVNDTDLEELDYLDDSDDSSLSDSEELSSVSSVSSDEAPPKRLSKRIK